VELVKVATLFARNVVSPGELPNFAESEDKGKDVNPRKYVDVDTKGKGKEKEKEKREMGNDEASGPSSSEVELSTKESSDISSTISEKESSDSDENRSE